MSGEVPDGLRIECTGVPGHRVAEHYIIGGSNEISSSGSRRPFRADAGAPQLSHFFSATVFAGNLADSLTPVFLVILPSRSFEEIDQ